MSRRDLIRGEKNHNKLLLTQSDQTLLSKSFIRHDRELEILVLKGDMCHAAKRPYV